MHLFLFYFNWSLINIFYLFILFFNLLLLFLLIFYLNRIFIALIFLTNLLIYWFSFNQFLWGTNAKNIIMLSLTKKIETRLWQWNFLFYSLCWSILINILSFVLLFFQLKINWSIYVFLRFNHFNYIHYFFLFIVNFSWMHLNELIFLSLLYWKTLVYHINSLYLNSSNLTNVIIYDSNFDSLLIKYIRFCLVVWTIFMNNSFQRILLISGVYFYSNKAF